MHKKFTIYARHTQMKQIKKGGGKGCPPQIKNLWR